MAFFHWFYKLGFLPVDFNSLCGIVSAAKKNSELHKKPIVQLDLSMNIVKEWDSLQEAAIFLNKSVGNIWSGIRYNKVRYGHYWKYKENKTNKTNKTI